MILPWFEGEDLVGQLEIINERAFRFGRGAFGGMTVEDVPPEFRSQVADLRSELVARIADLDDSVAALWLENQTVSPEVLKRAIRRATIDNRFIPVIGGSAYKYVGVQPLIDAVVDYLPSPADIPSVRVHLNSGEETSIPVDGLKEGVLAGYPVMDAHVEILDGADHATDSCDQSFHQAARFAVREAMQSADPVLLEPVMSVEVDTPVENQGDLLGDLNRRRGRVHSVETGLVNAVLKAEVPLSELWGYANAIRCLSRGRASYSMTPLQFEVVPAALAREILQGHASR